jgi:hypothetical protein
MHLHVLAEAGAVVWSARARPRLDRHNVSHLVKVAAYRRTPKNTIEEFPVLLLTIQGISWLNCIWQQDMYHIPSILIGDYEPLSALSDSFTLSRRHHRSAIAVRLISCLITGSKLRGTGNW